MEHLWVVAHSAELGIQRALWPFTLTRVSDLLVLFTRIVNHGRMRRGTNCCTRKPVPNIFGRRCCAARMHVGCRSLVGCRGVSDMLAYGREMFETRCGTSYHS